MAFLKPKGHRKGSRFTQDPNKYPYDRTQFIDDEAKKERVRIEQSKDKKCRTHKVPAAILGDRWDLDIPFEDHCIVDVCGDSDDNCEKTAEALFQAGIETVSDYRRARETLLFDGEEIQYLTYGDSKRISRIREEGLLAVDKLIATQEQEYIFVKSHLLT